MIKIKTNKEEKTKCNHLSELLSQHKRVSNEIPNNESTEIHRSKQHLRWLTNSITAILPLKSKDLPDTEVLNSFASLLKSTTAPILQIKLQT